jgi:hypothetical protein
MEATMREAVMLFICLVGALVAGFWTLALTLMLRSGKNIRAYFRPRRMPEWLSIQETMQEYQDAQSFSED